MNFIPTPSVTDFETDLITEKLMVVSALDATRSRLSVALANAHLAFNDIDEMYGLAGNPDGREGFADLSDEEAAAEYAKWADLCRVHDSAQNHLSELEKVLKTINAYLGD